MTTLMCLHVLRLLLCQQHAQLCVQAVHGAAHGTDDSWQRLSTVPAELLDVSCMITSLAPMHGQKQLGQRTAVIMPRPHTPASHRLLHV